MLLILSYFYISFCFCFAQALVDHLASSYIMTPSEIAHLVATVQGYFDKKAYLPNTRVDIPTAAGAAGAAATTTTATATAAAGTGGKGQSKRSELESLLRDQQAMLRDLQQAADATKELMAQTTQMLEKTA